MLFNSYTFILLFLPVTVAGYFVFGRGSRTWALGWLILASIFFYAWWNPLNVAIMGPSILFNFFLARTLLRLGQDESKQSAAKLVLLLGLVFNVMFLGYFKYINFVRGAANDVFGAEFTLTAVILPLGISFITFQKIAFLIDVHSGRIESFKFRDYLLFVLFFPQLIAGPIVHYREVMPQFNKVSPRFVKEDVAVGLTLFFIGLFKKVFFADSIAALVSPIYQDAAAGEPISFLMGWMAALGFTLQIYFDFSGYSDMALGLARLFGVRLPANFNSPLRASSMIDFWQRWHMTLTRFLTAYMYNPLSLWLTRRRLSKGHSGLSGRNTTFGAFVYLLMFPTLLTMLVSGVWHGAGYNFMIWGVLHGVYLATNHAWRLVGPQLWPSRESYERFMAPAGLILTLVAVTVSMVFFRATTMEGAIHILRGMAGLDGLALPERLIADLGVVGTWLQNVGVTTLATGNFLKLMLWTAGLLFVALACPNTLELLAPYEPALGVKVQSSASGTAPIKVPEWAPSVLWATAIAVIAMLGVANLTGPSEFLYWQF
jgi:D-alanyl-lipoteichoic acid acyltransferase DltB (MBOAT superfamily)